MLVGSKKKRSSLLGFKIRIYLPKVESLRVQSLWLLKIALPSREETDFSLALVNSKARLILGHYARSISLKHGSALNTRSNDLYVVILNM